MIGIGNWLISFLIPNDSSYKAFFDINAVIIILLFLISALLVRRIKPEYSYLFPAAPAVIASLFINWDIWAVVTALLAIYYFDQGKYEQSAIALGISIATKFFPVVLLLPIAVIFYRSGQVKQLYKYIFTCSLFWSAINLPIALLYFDGWWRFFKLNLERGEDFGSIWYAFSLLDFSLPNTNVIYIILSVILFVLFTKFLLQLKKTPTLAQVALFVVVIFTTFSKVYSPQYILWLTPLAVIALQNSRQLITFWFWQTTEIIYHLAIWQYLALYAGAEFGLPAGGYAFATLLRVVGVGIFTQQLLRDLAVKSTVK